jgi:predicted aconitase
MSEKMQIEIDRAVNKFTPPMEIGGGFLSREDFKTFARKAVTEGTMIGWVHAENMTRERLGRKIEDLEHEINILRERVKEVELELMAAQK